jgi:hypothetical protein
MTVRLNKINDYETKSANESAEATPFLVEILDVFEISLKKFATFERKVRKIVHYYGCIELL